MKILMINTVCGVGSTGRICTDLAEALEQNGHECKIAYGRGAVPEKYKKYAVKIGSDFDVNLHVLQTRLFDNTGFGSKKVTQKFINWVKEYNPDVVHLHNLHGYYINIELLFAYLAKAGKPLVWTLHDCWTFTGHCAYYDYVKCNKWQQQCCDCVQKGEYPKSILMDGSRRNFYLKKKIFTSLSPQKVRIVAPSQWLTNEVEKSFLALYPTCVINNDVDNSVFFPDENCKIEKRILGVANIWERRKGLEDFVELSALIPKDYEILVVGVSEKQQSFLQQYGIKAIKRTSNAKELANLYRSSTILFNPTYEDNYPTVNVEAIACELPVVTYRTGGSPEMVEKTGLGKVVASKDYDAVIDYLNEAFLRKKSNISMVEKSMVKKYISVYNDLVRANL